MAVEMSPLEKICLECKGNLKEIAEKCPFYRRFKHYRFKCPKCGQEIPIFWIDTAYYHQFKCGVSLKIVTKYKILEEKITIRR